jgi:2-oxoglutarate dehydrogenase E1 component
MASSSKGSKRYSTQSILSGQNNSYVMDLYKDFHKNPESIPSEWLDFFKQMGNEGAFEDIPSEIIPRSSLNRPGTNVASSTAPTSENLQNIKDSIRALMLIRAYRVRGHLAAHLDPLGIEKPKYHAELDPQTYGFTQADFEKPIFVDGVLGFEYATLTQILGRLRETYCHHVGIEFLHIQNPEQKQWLQEHFESPAQALSLEDRLNILRDLYKAEALEKFLHVKFPGAKRFGLDGCETLMSGVEELIKNLALQHNVDEIVIGMAHRGRLNMLVNTLGQPLRYILAMFMGSNVYDDKHNYGSGDVKYHAGYSTDREINGKKFHLSLTPNPSHLEAVNPVVLGKVRAKQFLKKDCERKNIVGFLLHGDAAFAGQGMVAETLELAGLKGYRTGGTIHIIINNQIGFTTSPPHSRTSPYSSEMAKIIQAPIFHVNGDNPEAFLRVIKIAADYQQKFGLDVVIDLIGYRKYGHNEGDEPSFTQPLMYKQIAQKPGIFKLYSDYLLGHGAIETSHIESIKQEHDAHLNQEFEAAKKIADDQLEKLKPDWFRGIWAGFSIEKDNLQSIKLYKTGLPLEMLKKIGQELLQIPSEFKLHPKLQRLWQQKATMIETGEGIDWGTAESLAFGTLLAEGFHVRLSGQDSGRGTFSHRHAVLVDQVTEEKFRPHNNINPDEGWFEVVDSPLAEASVLGYEYGYSTSNPNALVMWEGQFGDFANGAQVIIDQFIASAESKWLRLSGLVMLLPHGYEGQGPEHSSARLERYLQLCAEANLRVMNCSTPANYFHALRRQIHSPHRKPLIMMTPKSLLRHKLAVSSLEDMGPESGLQTVIPDNMANPSKIDRVVICSGKVYYDLYQAREERQLENVAIIRLEQFYPFPKTELAEAISPFKSATVIWCQEEPKNMGAWNFLDRRLEKVLKIVGAKQTRPIYAGRGKAASPATGLASRHQEEQNNVIHEALIKHQEN